MNKNILFFIPLRHNESIVFVFFKELESPVSSLRKTLNLANNMFRIATILELILRKELIADIISSRRILKTVLGDIYSWSWWLLRTLLRWLLLLFKRLSRGKLRLESWGLREILRDGRGSLHIVDLLQWESAVSLDKLRRLFFLQNWRAHFLMTYSLLIWT